MRLIVLCLGLLVAAPAAARMGEKERCGPERTPVTGMVSWELLCRATQRAASELPQAEADELLGLLVAPVLHNWSGAAPAWIGPHREPVIIEVVGKALRKQKVPRGTVPEQEVAYALWTFVNKAFYARTQEDLEHSASALAWAVKLAGVKVVTFILTQQILEPVEWFNRPPDEPVLASARRAVLDAQWAQAAPASPAKAVPPGWPHLSSSEEVLAPFLACTSPAEFIELQRGVDMARLVEGLDAWSAVRLGAQGPLVAGADKLHRKRAEFIVITTREYGHSLAQVFVLFISNSSFTDDMQEVLKLLAADKQLQETLGPMKAVHEALLLRGINFADYKDRPEQARDLLRGLASAAGGLLSSSEMSQMGLSLQYSSQKAQLPPPYQQALDEVEKQQLEEALTAGNMLVGQLDSLAVGIPMGCYNLVAGSCQGVHSLLQGQYEKATRELAVAVVLVSLYAGGKAPGALSKVKGAVRERLGKAGGLKLPELGAEGLQALADRLFERLGGQGMVELARYMQASREATLFVYETGEAGAVALYEARGNVGKAQAWLTEARAEGGGAARPVAGAGKASSSLGSLVDDAAGYTRDVVEAKLLQAELESTGARLSGDIAALEKQRPALEAPPPGAQGHPLWGEYVAYWESRLAELKQGRSAKSPLKWEAYEEMRGLFARGLAFERAMVSLLRADAALPRAQRRFLRDFIDPSIETNMGVAKPDVEGTRYVDVIVIEKAPPKGQPPRVETFSFKSRDFTQLEGKPLRAQMTADAREAFRYYGEALEIRRRSHPFFGQVVQIQRVRLIYEGGNLLPQNTRVFEKAARDVEKAVKGVEIVLP